MTDVCRQIELGRHGSVPEVMTKWEGIIPILYFRTSSLVVYVDVCAPENLLGSSWRQFQDCLPTALGAATLAALATTPGSAIPTFQTSLQACLLSKIGEIAKEIKISISSTQKANEDWHR